MVDIYWYLWFTPRKIKLDKQGIMLYIETMEIMNSHLRYARYLLGHKWFVFLECIKRGLFWRGVVHDTSKFLPSEWFPYARFFYGKDSTQGSRESRYQSIKGAQGYFQRAWQKHLMRNSHHWQNWVNIQDVGIQVVMEMPRQLAIEMVCDWIGAGRAQGYYSKKHPLHEVKKWYKKNMSKIILHPNTRAYIEEEVLGDANDR